MFSICGSVVSLGKRPYLLLANCEGGAGLCLREGFPQNSAPGDPSPQTLTLCIHLQPWWLLPVVLACIYPQPLVLGLLFKIFCWYFHNV